MESLWIDPDGLGQGRMLGRAADEAFWMTLVGDIKDGLPFGDKLGSLTVMNRGRGQQLQAGVMVLMVVPGKQLLAETPRILDGAEAVRIVRPVLHGFEMSFREKIVVGDMGAAVGFDDAEVSEQQGQGLRCHRRTAIGVQRELTGRNALLLARVFDKLPSLGGCLAIGDHPAGDVTAEDVENDVQVIEIPLQRASEFGDVPAPELIGCGGQQFGFPIRRMDELVKTFAIFAFPIQQSVYRANRAVILAIVQQRSVDLCRRTVLKAHFMPASQNGRLLLVLQPARGRPRRAHRRR